jgi:hypothetical protein
MSDLPPVVESRAVSGGSFNVATVTIDRNARAEFNNLEIWEFQHGLNKLPSVQTFDSAGTLIHGTVEHLDLFTSRITFTTALTGYATAN